MIVKMLMENTAASEIFECRHGLSIYIESHGRKILFDTGPDSSFLKNAEKMDVNIEDADLCILSHGHNDHGGGLEAFLKKNHTAPVLIRKNAFLPHISHSKKLPHDLSIDPALQHHPQVQILDKDTEPADGLFLFGNIEGENENSPSRQALCTLVDGQEVQDDFTHEQNLLVQENGLSVLFCGCAHCGIVPIMEKTKQILGKDPDICIGGFHLQNSYSQLQENSESLDLLARKLLSFHTRFYTCHCTGQHPYFTLKKTMLSSIHYLPAGSVLEIGKN